MPVSSDKGKLVIKTWVYQQTDIKSFVDLGPGSGTYPKLLGPSYTWKAVEIWGPYIEKFVLDKYYSEIRIGDIRYMDLPKADCAIIGDVLEHVPKEDAIRLFNKIDKKYNHVILSIPTNSPLEGQKYLDDPKFDGFGNKYEGHLSTWSYSELENLIPPSYNVRERVDPLAIYIK
jgi:hypothetical protein